mgnify:CR=1 FL=1
MDLDTLMPQVFGLPEINFWQSFRIFLISAILFDGTEQKEYLYILPIT